MPKLSYSTLSKKYKELKNQNKKLLEEKNMLRNLIDHLPDEVYIKDIKGRFILSNNANSRALGKLKQDEVLGKTDFDFLPPKKASEYYKEEQQIIKTSIPMLAKEISSEDFKKWILCTKIPIKNKRKTICLIGINRNITKIKLAENETREKEKKIRDVFDNMPDIYYRSDLNGKIIDINNTGVKTLRYNNKEELIGKKNLNEFYFDPEIGAFLIKKTMEDGKIQNYELLLKRKNGSPLPIEVNSQIVYDNTGSPAGVEGIGRDISEKISSEKKLKDFAAGMELLSSTALGFVELSPEDNIYEYIAKQLKTIIRDSIILVNSFDERTNSIFPKELLGLGKYSQKVFNLTNGDPKGKSYKVPMNVQKKMSSGKLEELKGGLYELSFKKLPKHICRTIENLIGIDKIYGMGISRKGRIYGNIIIALKKGNKIINKDVIETFVYQSAVALQHKIAEKEIRKSREKYRALVDSATDAIGLFDKNANIISVNLETARIFKNKPQNIIGRNFSEFFSKKLTSDFSHALYLIFKKGKHLRGLEAKAPTGYGMRWFNMILSPVKDESNNVISVLGIARDITRQKKIEEALKESEEKHRKIFENANDAITYLSMKGKILNINKKGIEIFGGDKDEIIGKNFLELKILPPKYLPSIKKIFKSVISGKRVDLRTPVINRNGKEIITESSTSFIKTTKKDKGILVVTRDITDREEAEKAIRTNEEKYRSIFESFIDVYIRFNNNKEIEVISPSVKNIFGYKSNELIGKPMKKLCGSDEHCNYLLEILSKKGRVKNYEINAVHKKGNLINISLNASFIKDEYGNPIAVEGVFRDITDKKKMEEQIRQYTENLEKLVEQRTAQMIQSSKLASLGTFAAGVAHEKRQYLQAILANAQRLLIVSENYLNSNDLKGYVNFTKDRVKSIEESINASNSLTTSLLAYSKGNPEKFTLVSPEKQFKNTLNIVSHVIEGDNIKLKAQINSTDEIKANEVQIREMAMNLITNAHHAVLQTNKKIKKIDVLLEQKDNDIYIFVEDNGIGMTPEEQKTIFDPFYTTKSPHLGTGLGLSLVLKYVENHKGEIAVNSKKGVGTTFKIKLPVIKE